MILPVVIGGVAAGAAVFSGIHAYMPTSQLYGATFFHATGAKQLALTYDDGPNDPHTLHLLDLLDEFQVKATFFLIGKHVVARPDIVQRISAAGHTLGNHTYTHPHLAVCSAERTRQEITDCAKAISDAASAKNDGGVGVFRCPFGSRRPATLKIVREMGMTPIQWDVTCFDWKQTTADRVAGHAQRQIDNGGNVILLHDGGDTQMGIDRAHSVQATRTILERYTREGFRFVTVPQMIKASA